MNSKLEANMTLRQRIVMLMQLPEVLDAKQGRVFIRELTRYLDVERPRIVLDCSNLRRMNRSALETLLCCLEEAMKRNGDVKLAALSQEAKLILEHTGVDRLFRIFDTTTDAVNSFQSPVTYTVSQSTVPEVVPQTVRDAA